MTDKKILFTPEIELDPKQAPIKIAIKGQIPQRYYPFTLKDIYPLVPSLNASEAYKNIQKAFERVNHILSEKLKLRESFSIPPVKEAYQALSVLHILFDPANYYTDTLWKKISISAPNVINSLEIDHAMPFPMRLASPQKLLHSLCWIDSNIKIKIENLTKSYNVSQPDVQEIVESSLKIYSYLIKQQDYRLARTINFNFSMFLQERILNLLFGDRIYNLSSQFYERGKLANHIALELLKNLGPLSHRQICTLSVFMGVIATSTQEVHQSFKSTPSVTLGNIEIQLNTLQKNWCIDHIDQFLIDIGTESPSTVAVVLDDNGESVFDMVLFQRLLSDIENLRVIFIVNRYPVSINIALATFQTLLNDAYFADLRQFFEQGRAILCVEQQVFYSFELAHLQPHTWQAVKQSQFVYIKGAAFFETFQIPAITRYYCFTVHNYTTKLLTGCSESKGVFVKLAPNQTGFTYHSFNHIETLKDKLK